MQLIFLFFGILAVTEVALALWLFFMWRRFGKLFGRIPAPDYISVVREALTRLQNSEEFIKHLATRADDAASVGAKSIQRVGFRRFNPFEHTGGDQSFSLCLLDRESNGVIISSLYGREGTRVYAKAVEAGNPKHPVSEEERAVLREAIEKGI